MDVDMDVDMEVEVDSIIFNYPSAVSELIEAQPSTG
jgi:hypothetical protein